MMPLINFYSEKGIEIKITFLLLMIGVFIALLAQYGFGIEPCDLCQQQRQIYYVGIFVSCFSLWMDKRVYKKFLLIEVQAFLVFLLAYSLYLSIRHSGIEVGLWSPPVSCRSSGQIINDINDLSSNYKFVPCDMAWRFFGILSFANLNALLSAFLLFLNARFNYSMEK